MSIENMRRRLRVSRQLPTAHTSSVKKIITPTIPFTETPKQEGERIKTDIINRYMAPDFRAYHNIHKGKSFIVCGCGSSMKDYTDFSGFITIGVNDIERILTPDYLVVVNEYHSFTRERWPWVYKTEASVVFTQIPNMPVEKQDRIVRINLGTRGGTNLTDPTRIDFTNNSPYMAVIIAAMLGADKIGLVGVDFTPNHFFAQTGTHRLNSGLGGIDSEYSKLGESLLSKGIQIANLSQQSQISSWPKMSLTQFKGL
jgi:hypothetical protein